MTAWFLTIWSLLVPNQPPIAPMYPEGTFRANGGYEKFLLWPRPHDGEVPYDSGVGPGTGVIRSGPFPLPSAIHFFTAGFLAHPGFRIYLADEKGSRTLDLRQRIQPGMAWRMHFWKIPADWQGSTVRLVAEDNAKGPEDWLCITAPKAGGEPLAVSMLRAAGRSGLIVYFGLLFLLPGTAVALLLARKVNMDFMRLVSTVVCASGTVCYAGFWVYLASHEAGKNYSLIVLAGSVVYLAGNLRVLPKLPGLREAAACLALALTLGVFYSAIGFLYITDDQAGEQAQVRFSSGPMPPDNLLPDMLAERLYKGEPVRPALFSFWHSSDRPPLQASMAMLTFPLSPVLLTLAYQLLSVFLQCIWAVGLWVLVRAAGLGNRYLVPIFGFAIVSELCIFHSFYVWPKLMASGFLLLALAQVFRGTWSLIDVALSAACSSLALLSHPSVLFTLIPVAAFVVAKRCLPEWRKLGAGLAIVLVFLLPWRWYQTVYDPPGDFLLKANMTDAGRNTATLDRPFIDLLKESYGRLSPASYLKIKADDWKTLYTGSEIAGLQSTDFRKALAAWNDGMFFHLFWSIGLLNIAFVARFFAKTSTALRFADHCLWLVLGSVLIWMATLYEPGATVVHQWSLASVLLLFMLLIVYLIESRPQLVYPLLGVQLLCVAPLLIFAKPFIEQVPGAIMDAPLDPGMAAVALLMLIGMIYAGWRAKLQEI